MRPTGLMKRDLQTENGSELCSASLYVKVKAELGLQSGMKDIIEANKKDKYIYVSHVSRLRDGRWTTRATDWTPKLWKRTRGLAKGKMLRRSDMLSAPHMVQYGQRWQMVDVN